MGQNEANPALRSRRRKSRPAAEEGSGGEKTAEQRRTGKPFKPFSIDSKQTLTGENRLLVSDPGDIAHLVRLL